MSNIESACSSTTIDLLQEVLEQNERLRSAFGHGGMVSAAESIFRDLDENGILRTLLHGADYNSQRWAHLRRAVRSLRGNLSWKQACKI